MSRTAKSHNTEGAPIGADSATWGLGPGRSTPRRPQGGTPMRRRFEAEQDSNAVAKYVAKYAATNAKSHQQPIKPTQGSAT